MFFSLEVEEAVARIMVTTTEVVAGVCLSTVQDHGAMAMEMERDTEQEVEEHFMFTSYEPETSEQELEKLK